MEFKYIDLFAGMGGIRLGLEQALSEKGIKGECVLTSEIKSHALQVYKENFGEDNIVGDISEIQGKDIPDFDMLLAGFPCFTGDALVLTKKGYKEIKNVAVGDIVISHDSRYYTVTDVLDQGVKSLVRIEAMPFDSIETTYNHMFYVREKFRVWDNELRKYKRVFSDPKWLTIEELLKTDVNGVPTYKNYYVGSAINQESIIPIWDGVTVNVNQFSTKLLRNLDMHDSDLWYLAGRYLGDGWLRKKRNGKYRANINGVVICCGKQKKENFESKIGSVYNFTLVEDRTTYKYHFTNTELGEFLKQFGEGAANKRIPGFVFDLPIPLLSCFLDGYFDSDGSNEKGTNYVHAISVSRELIYGLGQCIQKVYKRPCSISKTKVSPTKVIEGRVVNQRDYYTIRFKRESDKQDKAFYDGIHTWGPIKRIVPIEESKQVWDITVDCSHSFTVNNCIVHNCQPFSSAGRQRGFEDTRGTLFFEVARILKEKQPAYFLLENVENLVIHDLSREDKKKGKTIGKTLETILFVLKDLGYEINWRVLQASDFGVAQMRRRIYIVGSKKGLIDLNNFEKKFVSFGEVQEIGKDCVDSLFSKKLFKYLEDNHLSISFLYDKAIRDKRGSSNNIHSWTLGLRGDVTDVQHDLLEKMVTERRRSDLAKKKGLPLKDGLGLSKSEMLEIYKGTNIDLDISKLLQFGYLKEQIIDNYPDKLYDIVGGRLSYEFTKILDPTKPCLTLVATDASKLGVIDGLGIRKLTLKEGLKLNGYPDNYKLNLPYRKGLDLLGNTVVVPVIKSICERVLEDAAKE